jgi:phosphate starvation-inducible PhoH-like protein
MDVFEEYFSPEDIKAMLEDRVIEISPLAYMRGRTFKDCYIIADEIQNATPNQVKMLLTRMGEGSYCSVTGDLNQHDRGFEANGLKDFVERLEERGGSHGMGVTYFARGDIERDPIVQSVLEVYGEGDEE